MIRGEPAIGHEQSRANHACIRLNPHRVPTMKQSYASAGKAPRRRVHSPSGIVAIAVCGLPSPRIVIGYRAFKRSQIPNPVFVLSRSTLLLTPPIRGPKGKTEVLAIARNLAIVHAAEPERLLRAHH